MILKLYPNGSAPLTAIMSKCSNEKVTDPHFHWWTKALATQRATITGRYTTTNGGGAGTPYVDSGAKGDVLYIGMAEADIDKFRAGHQIVLRLSTSLAFDTVAKITSTAKAGANSEVVCTLLMDDPGTDLATADVIWVIGNINAEGATLPDTIMYDPVEHANFTQIYRTPLSHTRTAKRTTLRTGEQVKQARREALELHGIEMEKSYIFGIKTVGIGSNGKPERTTAGLRSFITTNAINYADSGVTAWLTDGEAWFDLYLEQLFRFGSNEKIAFCGSMALLAIQNLAKARGTFELTKMAGAYGVNVLEYVTAFGTLYLKSHPLLTYEPTTRSSMLIVDTPNLTNRYLDDTMYLKDRQPNDLDGEYSEYLTEQGMEVHHEETHGYIDNLGADSVLAAAAAVTGFNAPTGATAQGPDKEAVKKAAAAKVAASKAAKAKK